MQCVCPPFDPENKVHSLIHARFGTALASRPDQDETKRCQNRGLRCAYTLAHPVCRSRTYNTTSEP